MRKKLVPNGKIQIKSSPVLLQEIYQAGLHLVIFRRLLEDPIVAHFLQLLRFLEKDKKQGPRKIRRIADSYAGLFLRTATLRSRLVLLLAILETRPPFHQTIDKAIEGSMPVLIVRLGLTAAGALFSLVAGTLIFAPARMVLALVGRGPR